MKKNNKPNKIKKLSRSGNPAKRAKVPQAKIQKAKASARDRFLRITGLVVIGALGASLLVSMFGNF
jgi:hypothetical protein